MQVLYQLSYGPLKMPDDGSLVDCLGPQALSGTRK